MNNLMKPDRKLVGDRIRIVKNELGSSLAEFGARLGINKSTLNSYMRGYALAPIEIIEQLSLISDKPVEWFYYGTVKDYIREYLSFKGYSQLLADFPNIPIEMEKLFLQRRREGALKSNELYPDEELMDIWFSDYYNEAMKKYIFGVVGKFVGKQTDCPENKKDEISLLIGHNIYEEFEAFKEFKYGDEQAIIISAKSAYNNDFKDESNEKTSIDDDYLVGKLIRMLSDDYQTSKIIELLSQELTGHTFSPSFGGEELIKIFQSIRPKLIELYANSTRDDYYDWFEK